VAEDVPVVARDATDAQVEAWIARQDQAVQAVLRQLTQIQQRVIAALAQVDTAHFAQQSQTLRRLVEDLGTRFRQDATGLVQAGQRAAIPLGQALVDVPLLAAGIRLALPEVTVPLLETLLSFAADKVTGLSQDLVARITTEIQLGVLGTQNPFETMQRVQEILGLSEPPGGIAARAEAITRTETGRVHSTATQRRLEQARRSLPDLMKEWLHGGSRIPRSGHVAANGQRVPVDQPFMVAATVGGTKEAMMYPRDPRASARNTVHCRCTHIPWLQRWAEAAA
jgi:hypothetical protein